MAVPVSMKPVRRRMALRCSRRSRFRLVLGDIPVMLTPVAHSFASCHASIAASAINAHQRLINAPCWHPRHADMHAGAPSAAL